MSKFFLFSGIFLLIILIPLGISPSLSFSSLVSKLNALPKEEKTKKIKSLLNNKTSCSITWNSNDASFSEIISDDQLLKEKNSEKTKKLEELKNEYQSVMGKVQKNYPVLSKRLLHYQDLQYAIFNLKNAQELLAIFLFAPQFAFLRKWKDLEVNSQFFLSWFYNPILSYLPKPTTETPLIFGISDPVVEGYKKPFEFKCYSRFLFYKFIFMIQNILGIDENSFSATIDATIFQQNKEKILNFLQKKIDYNLQLKLKTTKKILADNFLPSLPLYKKFSPDYYLMFFSPSFSNQTYEITSKEHSYFHSFIDIYCRRERDIIEFGDYNSSDEKSLFFTRQYLLTAALCQKVWNNKIYSPQSFGFNRVSFLLFLRNIFAEKSNWLKRSNQFLEIPISFTSSKSKLKNNQKYYDDLFLHKKQSGKQIYIDTKKVNDLFFKKFFSPDHNYDQISTYNFFQNLEKKAENAPEKKFISFPDGYGSIWTYGYKSNLDYISDFKRIYPQDSHLSLNNQILVRIGQKLINLEKLWIFFRFITTTKILPELKSSIKLLDIFKKNPQYLKLIENNKNLSFYNLEKKALLNFVNFIDDFFQEINFPKEKINEEYFTLNDSNLLAKLGAYVLSSKINQNSEKNVKKIKSDNKIVFYLFISIFLTAIVIFIFIFFKTKMKNRKTLLSKKQ